MAPRTLTPKELADLREQLELDLGSTGEWRSRVQSEYPEDGRNAEAADIITTLENSVADIPDELLIRYNALWTSEAYEEHLHEMSEDWSQKTREIGFYSEPSSAQELLEEFVSEWEAKLEPPTKPTPRRRAIRS